MAAGPKKHRVTKVTREKLLLTILVALIEQHVILCFDGGQKISMEFSEELTQQITPVEKAAIDKLYLDAGWRKTYWSSHEGRDTLWLFS